MKKLVILICLFTTAGIWAKAQEKITFRYNPPIGEKISYNTTMNIDVEGEESVIMDINMKLYQTATGKAEDGVISLVSQIQAVKVEMNAGMMIMTYDSENPDDSNPLAQQLGQQFESLLNKDIHLTVNESAEVIDITGGENFSGFGDLKSMFSTASFPTEPVAEGESWDMTATNDQLGMEIAYKLTYVGKEDGFVRVNVASELEEGAVNISATGYNLYDPVTFVVIKSDITSTLDAQGTTFINRMLMEKQ